MDWKGEHARNSLSNPSQYDPTVEESYLTTIDLDGKALQIEILDTAGQHEYTPLRETFMHTGDGFLLVYSIVDDQTFEELRDIHEQIMRVHQNADVKRYPLFYSCDRSRFRLWWSVIKLICRLMKELFQLMRVKP